LLLDLSPEIEELPTARQGGKRDSKVAGRPQINQRHTLQSKKKQSKFTSTFGREKKQSKFLRPAAETIKKVTGRYQATSVRFSTLNFRA
jgi:hypothetical protein